MSDTSAQSAPAWLSEKFAESLAAPLPAVTPRRVFGAVHLPGKASAVSGMRRAGKTTCLHQIGGERVAAGTARERLARELLPGIDARPAQAG